MKIIGTTKKKSINLHEIDIVLTIDEIDNLIKFLDDTKKSFIDRQKDSSVKKMIEIDGFFESKNITSYSEIVKLGNKVIDYHSHYKDWCKNNVSIDFVVHTTFEAEEMIDDTFVWVNKEFD